MQPGVRFLPSPGAAKEPNYNVNATVDFWVPTEPNPKYLKEPYWNVVARLRAGTTPQQGQQEQWHEIAHDFVRQELHCVEPAANWIKHRAMSPKIGKRLRDHSHAHFQFIVASPICLFGADGVRLVDGAQTLLDHFGRNDEVAARFVIKRDIR